MQESKNIDALNPLMEFEMYINEVFNSINESEESSPTFEWDIAKEKIDNSKKGIDTAEKAYEYFNWFLEKIKSLPKSIKLRLTKYVAASLFVLLGATTINSVVSDKAPDISKNIAIAISTPSEEPAEEVSVETPTNVSNSLIKFLKYEEGSIKDKGEPVLKAYNIGDGMITIGWGHAEAIGSSNFKKGDVISYEKAEILLAQDIAEAKAGLDRLLSRWDEEGIEYNIDQGMYDAMVSMIFNMGIGNFLKSDFIQLVKKGKYNQAADKILTTNVSYPGHIPRREKEKEIFSGEQELTQLAMNEIRKIIREIIEEAFFKSVNKSLVESYIEPGGGLIDEAALRVEDLPETTALFVRDINQGFDVTLYEPTKKTVYGTLTAVWRKDEGPDYFVSGVAAKKGFGPLIYELAMMRAAQDGKGLMPTRDGDVRSEAWSVWKKFYDRSDIKKKNLPKDSSYFRLDILGLDWGDFDSKEEIDEWFEEAGAEDLKTLKAFNTVYYINQNNEYDELVGRANKYVSNGFDEQKAIDAAENFWYDQY